MLERFFLTAPVPDFSGRIETGAYEPWLVFLSYIVAAFAAYTAIDLNIQLRKNQLAGKNGKWSWLQFCSAVALGAGIWSMHFIGMLAYKMDMAIRNHTWQGFFLYFRQH